MKEIQGFIWYVYCPLFTRKVLQYILISVYFPKTLSIISVGCSKSYGQARADQLQLCDAPVKQSVSLTAKTRVRIRAAKGNAMEAQYSTGGLCTRN